MGLCLTELSFRQHIGSIVKKVYRMIGLTRRTTARIHTTTRVYKTTRMYMRTGMHTTDMSSTTGMYMRT